jgi:FixJ family two-component response regulator
MNKRVYKYRSDRRVPPDHILQELIDAGLSNRQIALMYDVSTAAVGHARAPHTKKLLERKRRGLTAPWQQRHSLRLIGD